MVNKSLLYLGMMFVLLSGLVATSCSGTDTTATSQQVARTAISSTTTTNEPSAATTSASAAVTTTTQSVTSTADTTAAATEGDFLGNILAMAKGIKTMKYTMAVTMPDQPESTATVWMKQKKMRMDVATEEYEATMYMDMEAQTAITYIPAENMALKISYDQGQKSAVEEVTDLEQYAPYFLTRETIDGNNCLVYEYTQDDGAVKIWLWEDYGVPLRMETTFEGDTTVMQFMDYDFSDIPDSMFELPAGVEVMDMMDMIGDMTGGMEE